MTKNFEKYEDWIVDNIQDGDIVLERIAEIENEITMLTDETFLSKASVVGGPSRWVFKMIMLYYYDLDVELNGCEGDVSREQFSDLSDSNKVSYLRNSIALKDNQVKNVLYDIRKFLNVISHPDFSEGEVRKDHKNINKFTAIKMLNDFAILFDSLKDCKEKIDFRSEVYYKRNEVEVKTELRLANKIRLEENRGIKINDDSILNVIYSDDYEFRIPMYQRGYAWENKELKTLEDDIDNMIDRMKNMEDISSVNEHHFFGNLSLISGVSNDMKREIKVADGQQRLTTILLLLKAIHNKFKKVLKDDSLIDNNLCKFINSEIPLKRIDNQLTIDVMDSIWKGNEIKNTIEKDTLVYRAFDHLTKWISKKEVSEVELLLTSLSRFIVGINWLTDVNEFELFESINSKGRKLTNFDIFKNYIYSLIDKDVEQKDESIIVRKFEMIIEQKFETISNIKKKNEAKEIFMKTFIEYFLNKKVDSENVFNDFKFALKNWRETKDKPINNLSLDEFNDLLLDISRFIVSVLLTIVAEKNTWTDYKKLSEVYDHAQFVLKTSVYSKLALHYIFRTNLIEYSDINGGVFDVIDKEELIKFFNVLESWKVRRDISTDITSESASGIMSKFISEYWTLKENYLVSLIEMIKSAEGLIALPSMDKFIDRLKNHEITVKASASTILYRIHQSLGGENIKLHGGKIFEPIESDRSKAWDKLFKEKELLNQSHLNMIGNYYIHEDLTKFKKVKQLDIDGFTVGVTSDNFTLNINSNYDDINSIKDLYDVKNLDDFFETRINYIIKKVTNLFII